MDQMFLRHLFSVSPWNLSQWSAASPRQLYYPLATNFFGQIFLIKNTESEKFCCKKQMYEALILNLKRSFYWSEKDGWTTGCFFLTVEGTAKKACTKRTCELHVFDQNAYHSGAESGSRSETQPGAAGSLCVWDPWAICCHALMCASPPYQWNAHCDNLLCLNGSHSNPMVK